jgi:gamma-glutamylcyclotransferase (GGCT)/AIG2-like uncharacterized protein YtfP
MSPPGLFSYGTLQNARVFRTICGRWRNPTTAQLTNFVCRKIVGANYPGIFYRKKKCVTGLYFNLITKTMWRRLDEYEGYLYRRSRVRVRTERGFKLAFVYQIRSSSRKRLGKADWNPSQSPQSLSHLLANIR